MFAGKRKRPEAEPEPATHECGRCGAIHKGGHAPGWGWHPDHGKICEDCSRTLGGRAETRCGVSVTPRAMEALRFVQGYQIAHRGVSPSLKEIAEGIGSRATSRVFFLLMQLEERGWIKRRPFQARAIDILRPVPVPRSPGGEPLRFISHEARP